MCKWVGGKKNHIRGVLLKDFTSKKWGRREDWSGVLCGTSPTVFKFLLMSRIAKECIIKKALMWRTLLDVVCQLHIYRPQRVLLGFVNLLLDITTDKHERALLLRFLRFPSSAGTATCLGQRRPVQAYMKQLKLALLYFYVCCLHTEPMETSQWQAPRISPWFYLSNEQRDSSGAPRFLQS